MVWILKQKESRKSLIVGIHDSLQCMPLRDKSGMQASANYHISLTITIRYFVDFGPENHPVRHVTESLSRQWASKQAREQNTRLGLPGLKSRGTKTIEHFRRKHFLKGGTDGARDGSLENRAYFTSHRIRLFTGLPVSGRGEYLAGSGETAICGLAWAVADAAGGQHCRRDFNLATQCRKKNCQICQIRAYRCLHAARLTEVFTAGLQKLICAAGRRFGTHRERFDSV